MPRYGPTRVTRRYRESSRSWNGWAPISTASSFLTSLTRCRTPRAAKVNGATRLPRNRAALVCVCNTLCRMRALSMFRRPGPPRSTISPMRSGSGCGAATIFRLRRVASSSRRLKRAASRRWKCWPATSRRSVSTRPARSPTDGVEYELVEHRLTDEQIRIYDAYAGAFGIIHNNLDAAMRAANITGETGTLNGQAKSAARSAFESAKQRFFVHLLTSMKTPSLIRSIERDLDG